MILTSGASVGRADDGRTEEPLHRLVFRRASDDQVLRQGHGREAGTDCLHKLLRRAYLLVRAAMMYRYAK